MAIPGACGGDGANQVRGPHYSRSSVCVRSAVWSVNPHCHFWRAEDVSPVETTAFRISILASQHFRTLMSPKADPRPDSGGYEVTADVGPPLTVALDTRISWAYNRM